MILHEQAQFDRQEVGEVPDIFVLVRQYGQEAQVRANHSGELVQPTHESAEQELSTTETEAITDAIFAREFALPLEQLLLIDFPMYEKPPFRLGVLMQNGIDSIKKTRTPEDLAATQKALVRGIVEHLNEMPVGTWDTSPKQTLETKQTNCSGAAALFTALFESVQAATEIPKIHYVNPYGHATDIVHFSDQTIFYADPRNGIFQEITQDVEVEERDGLIVYRLKVPTPEIPFHFLPTLPSFRDMAVVNYVENMAEIPEAAEGVFDEILRNSATGAELREMQQEARVVRERERIAASKVIQWQKLKQSLGKSLDKFKQTPEFQKESEFWGNYRGVQEILVELESLAQADPVIKRELLEKKEFLREFLLHKTDTLNLSNKAIEEKLRHYRDSKHLLDIAIIHKNTEDLIKETDGFLAKF